MVTKPGTNDKIFLSLRVGIPGNIYTELVRTKDFCLPWEANSNPFHTLMFSVKESSKLPSWFRGLQIKRAPSRVHRDFKNLDFKLDAMILAKLLEIFYFACQRDLNK